MLHVLDGTAPVLGRPPTDRLWSLVADAADLGWLRSGCVDAAVADRGSLTDTILAEDTLADLARVLRPGGLLFVVLASLLSGLARLADQGRWVELTDAPSADVVLVPARDGSVSRCYRRDEVRGLLTDAGFEVSFVRPFTVLPELTVESALARDPAALPALVATELALADGRDGEPVGRQLLAAGLRRR